MDHLKILILEDQQGDAELVKYYASQVDYECDFMQAKSEGTFLKALGEFTPDIILSDYKVDGYDGLRALEHCSIFLPDVPFIMITGTLGEELAVKIIKQGANDFILKEKVADLPLAILRALREAREKREKRKAEEELKKTLANLERLVQERTEELTNANKILKEEVLERIMISRRLEHVNKEITDSINYAELIQKAMVSKSEECRKTFTDSSILWKPKAIVSGDFYWCHETDNSVFLAAIDCTGHGVPGAMMSMMVGGILLRLVKSAGIVEPKDILSNLDEAVVGALNENNKTVTDGMDIALCRVDKHSNEIVFAGAQRPLFHYDGVSLQEIQGDKFEIGGLYGRNSTKRFSQQTIHYKPGDCIYLTSDGYYSQFHHSTGKKMMKIRMKSLLESIVKKSAEEQKIILEKYFNEWKGKEDQVDDVLVMGVKF